MLSIYTYIPETNHVPREHRVAAILVLLFMVLISPVSALTRLYLYLSTFRSMNAVPNMAVFCSSLTFKNRASYIYPPDVAFYIFLSTNISTEYFKHAAHSLFFS
jgi:hypothetical protein